MRTTGANPLQRLLRRADFLRAARGVKAALPGLVLQVRRRSPDEAGGDVRPRVGYTASRKVGNAVTRNRARRRLRAAVADVLSARAEPGFDYVLIARAATAERPYDDLLSDLGKALDRAARPRSAPAWEAPAREAPPHAARHREARP